MKSQYNILFGLALIIFIASGYLFNDNKSVHTRSEEEISGDVYGKLENKSDFDVQWHFNVQAGMTAGVSTVGIGLILIGVISKKRRIA